MQYKADAFVRVLLKPRDGQKIYELAKPIHEIMVRIEASNQLALVQKLREHLH